MTAPVERGREAARRLWRAWDRVRRRAALLVATRGRLPKVCDDVAAWATEHSGARPQVLTPPGRATRSLPQTVEPAVDRRFLDRRVVDQPGRSLVPVHGARIVGARGLVVLPDGRFSSESVYGRALLAREPAYCDPRPRPVVPKPGDHFSLLTYWVGSGNYYHWMHDSLGNLSDVLERLPRTTTFIVPPDLTRLQQDTLAALGIAEHRLAPFTGDEWWELETLHFAPPATRGGREHGGFDHRADVDRWLRDHLSEGLGIAPIARTRRVLVSRRRARNRRVVNERVVEEHLGDLGFETHVLEELELREQARLFAEAAVVVAPHGAGLTNMVFAAPGLTVVEMIEPSKLDSGTMYWLMADALGHRYWYFLTDPVEITGPTPGHDMSVPLEKLTSTLARLDLDRGAG